MTPNSGRDRIASRPFKCYEFGMEDSYAIIWVARNRNGEGIGTKRLPRIEAESLAMELNREHPEFAHKAVDTGTEKVKEALQLLKDTLTSSDGNDFEASGPSVLAPAALGSETSGLET